jgi:hypothetical protein
MTPSTHREARTCGFCDTANATTNKNCIQCGREL